jgi:hypothetical protein
MAVTDGYFETAGSLRYATAGAEPLPFLPRLTSTGPRRVLRFVLAARFAIRSRPQMGLSRQTVLRIKSDPAEAHKIAALWGM